MIDFNLKPHRYIFLTVLVLVYLILYIQFLDSSYIYDDINQIVFNKSLHTITDFKSILFSNLRRARVWQNISFAIDWAISGPAPWSFRTTNIVLNLINVFIGYKVLKKLFSDYNIIVPVIGLFLIAPLQVQSINYIMGRISLIESFFYLLTLYVAISETNNKTLKLFLIILFSIPAKETCSLLILYILIIDIFYHNKKLGEIQWKRYFILLLPTILFYFYYSNSNMKDPYGFMHNGVVGFDLYPLGRYIFTQGYFYLFHFFLVLNPSYQALIHGFPAMNFEMLIKGGFGIIFIISSLISAFKLRKKYKEISLAVISFFFVLAPSNSVLQMINPFAEYRLYLANFFLFIVVIYIVKKFFSIHLKRIFNVAVVLLLSFYSIFTFKTLSVNKNYMDAFTHALELYPTFPRLYATVGSKLETAKSPLAEKFYMDAYRHYKNDPFPPTIMYDVMVLEYFHSQKKYKEMYNILSLIPYLPEDIFSLCKLFTYSYIAHLKLGGTYANYLPKLESNFKKLMLNDSCILYKSDVEEGEKYDSEIYQKNSKRK